MYWKEAVTAFKRHTNSVCHRVVIEAVETLPTQVQGIGCFHTERKGSK